jgi:hypothetical protein
MPLLLHLLLLLLHLHPLLLLLLLCHILHLSIMLMLVVAASFIARVSSDSLLLSSPTGVTSKYATSCCTSCSATQAR